MPEDTTKDTSGSKIPKFKVKSPVFITGVLLLLVLILGALYMNFGSPSKKLTKAEFDTKIQTADKNVSGNQEAAIQSLEQAVPNASDLGQKYALAYRLGNLYYYRGDLKQALKWYEVAQSTGQPGSENLSLNIGMVAESLGDKQKAIGAYSKVVELLEKQEAPSAKVSAEQYKAKIKALGG